MQTGTDKLLVSYNPEHGFIADMIESGWDKTIGKLLPSGNAKQVAGLMASMVEQDRTLNIAAHSQNQWGQSH